MVSSNSQMTEYEVYCGGIQTLFETYFKLATMTFTWNASLGTGVALTLNSGIKGADSWHFMLIITGFALSALAIVYNIGALKAYNYIVDRLTFITDGLGKLINSNANFENSGEIFANWKKEGSEKQKNQLIKFIRGFFILLTAIWACILIATIFQIYKFVIG